MCLQYKNGASKIMKTNSAVNLLAIQKWYDKNYENKKYCKCVCNSKMVQQKWWEQIVSYMWLQYKNGTVGQKSSNPKLWKKFKRKINVPGIQKQDVKNYDN